MGKPRRDGGTRRGLNHACPDAGASCTPERGKPFRDSALLPVRLRHEDRNPTGRQAGATAMWTARAVITPDATSEVTSRPR
jgi:hypothetical protein